MIIINAKCGLILMLSFINVMGQYEMGNLKADITNLNLPEGATCKFEGGNGTCQVAFRCLSMLVGLKTEKYLPLCSFKNGNPVVCCKDCELMDDIRTASFIPRLGVLHRNRGRLSARKCLQYLEDLPYNCKIRPEPELIYDYDLPVQVPGDIMCKRLTGISNWYGQERIDPKLPKFPHMALLGYGRDLDSAQYLCGGSIISEKYILTAAHCIQKKNIGQVKYVAVGILKRKDSPSMWKRYNVKRIIPYPRYRVQSRYHDIALLEISEKLEFNESVLPACLHVNKHEYYEELSYDPVFKNLREALEGAEMSTYAVSWGKSKRNQTTRDSTSKIILNKLQDQMCSKIHPADNYMNVGYDRGTQMCYEDFQGPETCKVDSGSSLLVDIRANVFDCQQKVLGVVSRGNPCGSRKGVGLYTRVDSYVPWIESVVWPGE